MRFVVRSTVALCLAAVPAVGWAQSAVTSVNGKSGPTVTLVPSDLGAAPTANPTFSGAASVSTNGTCDPSAWNGYYPGILGPIPRDYCSKISSAINILYPGLNGLGNEAGQAVPANDTTYEPAAQQVIQAITTQGNNRQETGLGINFRVVTGGGGAAQTQHNQKVALSVLARAEPGGGNMWAINTDAYALNGVGNYFFAGREADHTNFNGDYKPGGCNGTCPSGQINNVGFGDWLSFVGYPLTAGTYYSGAANSGSSNLHYGILFAAASGFTNVGTGLIGDATINDSSNAPVSYLVYGSHNDIINTTNATTTRVLSTKPGQQVCLNFASKCVTYDSTNALLNINDGKLLVNDTGVVTAAGQIYAPGLYQNGTGVLDLGNARGRTLRLLDAGGTIANSVTIQAAPTNFGPVISAAGTDTNTPLNLASKGASPIQMLSGTYFAAGISAPNLATGSGTGKGTVCSDANGNFYVKTSVGACVQ